MTSPTPEPIPGLHVTSAEMAPSGQKVAQRYASESLRLVEGMTREECCVRFTSKVLLLARRIHERFSRDSMFQLEDLVSFGAIGLLEAFDRFDPARGVQFTTYAEYRIRGAIYDAMRENDTFSRRHRALANRVQTATDQLRQQYSREPRPDEVASSLGIGLEDYWAAVDRVKPVSHVSLDHTSADEDGGRPLIDRLLGDSPPPDSGLRLREVRAALTESVANLPERHRHCVLMYYGKGLSLAEIAAVLDVTVSRVSQILSEARLRMKKRLDGVVDESDLQLENRE